MLEDGLSNEDNVPKDDDETQNSVFKKFFEGGKGIIQGNMGKPLMINNRHFLGQQKSLGSGDSFLFFLRPRLYDYC